MKGPSELTLSGSAACGALAEDARATLENASVVFKVPIFHQYLYSTDLLDDGNGCWLP